MRVLRDSLGRAPAASDFVLTGQDLGALFVDPALAWLKEQGCPVLLRTPVREIRVGRLGGTPGAQGGMDCLAGRCRLLVAYWQHRQHRSGRMDAGSEPCGTGLSAAHQRAAAGQHRAGFLSVAAQRL